jgi:gliding motility-associated-like protein
MKYKFPLFFFFIFCLVSTNHLFAQTADVQAGCVPLTVQFTAPTDASSFFWDFKDGSSTSETQNPIRTFNDAGTYVVDFKTSAAGAVVGSVTIQVFDRPEIDVTLDPAVGCEPATITLTNTPEVPEGMVIKSYTWDFGDLGVKTGKSVDIDIPNAGSYSYNLIITPEFNNCNSSETFTDGIRVAALPEPNFTIDPQDLFCAAPAIITISNATQGENLSYAWDLGNGNTSTDMDPGELTFNENGDYNISLTVTNEDGCSKTLTKKISVGPPIADFMVSANDTVCVGSPVIFNNLSSAGNYTWNVTGTATFNSSLPNPEYTFATEGAYTIVLKVTDPTGTCDDEITKTVFAQNIDATFVADPTYGCSEPYTVAFTPVNPVDGAMYNWEFGDDSTSTEVSPVHDFYADNESPYHQNGEFFFNTKLSVSTSAGCSAEFEVQDTLDIPLARFMPDTVSGCAPLTVEFSDSSFSTTPIVNWEWIYDDGNTADFSTADPHSYTFNNPGEYDVKLVITNELGCPDTSFVIRVEVGERIQPSFTVDKSTACQGEEIQFTDATNNPNIDEWHYYTDNNRSSHCFSNANPMIPFKTETGTFDVVMVVGYNGCLDSVKQTDFIDIKGPLAQIDYLMSCDTPNTVQFTSNSGDATSLSWDFGDMMTGTMEAEAHTYETTGDYKVVLTAENASSGCAPSVDSTIIKIRNVKADGPVKLKQCKGQPVMLNSESSTDVDTSCFRGYTWFFNHPGVRPVTTKLTTVNDVSYPDTGTYQIDLVVEDVNGCTDTARYPVVVHEPIVSFEVAPGRVCPGLPVNITNVAASTTSETIESFMWDFGDGVGMSEEQDPGSYTYGPQVSGDQVTISVMVEDDAGCPGSAEQTIDLYRITSAISGDVTVCTGETVDLMAVNSQNLDLTYEWTLGNNTNATGTAASTTYNEGGFYTVNLMMEEVSTGCRGLATTRVEVQDFPIADFMVEEPLCAPAAINFNNTSMGMITSSNWAFNINGQTSMTAAVNATRNFLTASDSDVTLVVATSNGCSAEVTKTITVNPQPQGAFSIAGNGFCIGDALMVDLLDSEDVESFSWLFQETSFGANEASATFEIPTISPTPNAKVSLILEGKGGCREVVEQFVAVSAAQPTFDVDINPCTFEVTLRNTSPSNYSGFVWDSGDSNTSNNPDSVTFKYTADGTYTVSLTATDGLGCAGTKTEAVIIQRNTTTDNIIPNAFTPEITSTGTGINDVFRVKNVDENTGLCSPVKRVLSFNIYNRWGKEVYSGADLSIEEGWDGRFKNEIQPAGVYVYAIEVEYEDNTTEIFKGDVTLIR